MNKNIGFISLGCAKNLTDTETMLGILSSDGFSITADASLAEVIVVNTCAFIDSAKEESINAILDMAEYKNERCELLMGVLSDKKLRAERIMARDGLDEAAAWLRINAQRPDEYYEENCSHVIYNNGTEEEFRDSVVNLLTEVI